MKQTKRLRIFVGEDERYQGRPLFEAIVLAAKERGLAGTTVLKGFMGYTPRTPTLPRPASCAWRRPYPWWWTYSTMKSRFGTSFLS